MFFFVADLPDDGPIISGSLPRYKTGDIISANCSSRNSLPAATLNWYINGEEATPAMLINYPVLETSRGRLTSILGLRYATINDYNIGYQTIDSARSSKFQHLSLLALPVTLQSHSSNFHHWPLLALLVVLVLH